LKLLINECKSTFLDIGAGTGSVSVIKYKLGAKKCILCGTIMGRDI
jgi:precorrin-6B methylase 2